MFDIGMLELVIVFVIALLILGPERLPRVAQKCGRWVGQARRTMQHWSTEVNRQIDNEVLQQELTKNDALEEAKQEIVDLNSAINQSISGASQPVIGDSR